MRVKQRGFLTGRIEFRISALQRTGIDAAARALHIKPAALYRLAVYRLLQQLETCSDEQSKDRLFADIVRASRGGEE
jgi:hypothetical protein